MKVYVIHPKLSIDMTDSTKEFYDVMIEELEIYLHVIRVNSDSTLLNTDFSESDSVIIFNSKDKQYSQNVRSFLNKLNKKIEKNKFFPIASCKESRVPCEIIDTSQSYDFVDKLAVRKLTEEHINVVAQDFARYVISSMQPTLTNEVMNIFISHRRADGEEKARDIFSRLQERANVKAYRDLIKVRAGQEAQEDIERNLALSDFVLFLDTPQAGNSIWIEKELRLAIKQNIPILWVKDGADINRKKLLLKPYDQPHIQSVVDEMNDEKFELFIEKIIKEGYKLVRKQSEKALFYLAELNRLSDEKLINLEWKDRNSMVATIKIPRPKSRYHERSLEHRIQIFGRNINNEDHISFERRFDKRNIDASLLLTPSKSSYKRIQEEILIDSLDDYLGYLENAVSPRIAKNKAIVISGAFPDCEPEFQSVLNGAVKDISESIILGGYKLIFGAHPTFKHLIVQAKNLHAKDDKSAIKMYVSKFFVTDGLIAEDEKIMTVVGTEQKDNIKSSLTLMRELMINDEDVVAMIVLGGKTSAGGHNPGIDEEISIAQKRGVPVFLLGSVGGRSSEIVQECIDTGSFDLMNCNGYDFNRNIAKETCYKAAVRKIMSIL